MYDLVSLGPVCTQIHSSPSVAEVRGSEPCRLFPGLPCPWASDWFQAMGDTGGKQEDGNT